MKFSRVAIASLEAELPDEVWSSELLEQKLAPVYERLKLPAGRLELMTGIKERRFWSKPIRPSEASALAGQRALAKAGVAPGDIDALMHCAVCRDRLEPATAAYVHGFVGLGPDCQIFDVSNACLGFLNGVIIAAAMIEAGLISRALVCSGENGRPLVEGTIAKLNADLSLTRNGIKPFFANLTIGAGAVAAVICRDDLAPPGAPRLLGGAVETDSGANTLCEGDTSGEVLVMETDSEALLAAGMGVAGRCWRKFKTNTGWDEATPDRVVTHQVGQRHSTELFKTLGLDPAKDRASFDRLGNVGSVSCPVTFALARDAGEIRPGDKVALLGIGSGLSSLMLAVQA